MNCLENVGMLSTTPIMYEGKEIVPPMYDDADLFFSEGVAKVKRDGKCGFINKEGKEIIPPTYVNAESFKEGLARVKF